MGKFWRWTLPKLGIEVVKSGTVDQLRKQIDSLNLENKMLKRRGTGPQGTQTHAQNTLANIIGYRDGIKENQELIESLEEKIGEVSDDEVESVKKEIERLRQENEVKKNRAEKCCHYAFGESFSYDHLREIEERNVVNVVRGSDSARFVLETSTGKKSRIKRGFFIKGRTKKLEEVFGFPNRAYGLCFGDFYLEDRVVGPDLVELAKILDGISKEPDSYAQMLKREIVDECVEHIVLAHGDLEIMPSEFRGSIKIIDEKRKLHEVFETYVKNLKKSGYVEGRLLREAERLLEENRPFVEWMGDRLVGLERFIYADRGCRNIGIAYRELDLEKLGQAMGDNRLAEDYERREKENREVVAAILDAINSKRLSFDRVARSFRKDVTHYDFGECWRATFPMDDFIQLTMDFSFAEVEEAEGRFLERVEERGIESSVYSEHRKMQYFYRNLRMWHYCEIGNTLAAESPEHEFYLNRAFAWLRTCCYRNKDFPVGEYDASNGLIEVMRFIKQEKDSMI